MCNYEWTKCILVSAEVQCRLKEPQNIIKEEHSYVIGFIRLHEQVGIWAKSYKWDRYDQAEGSALVTRRWKELKESKHKGEKNSEKMSLTEVKCKCSGGVRGPLTNVDAIRMAVRAIWTRFTRNQGAIFCQVEE